VKYPNNNGIGQTALHGAKEYIMLRLKEKERLKRKDVQNK